MQVTAQCRNIHCTQTTGDPVGTVDIAVFCDDASFGSSASTSSRSRDVCCGRGFELSDASWVLRHSPLACRVHWS